MARHLGQQRGTVMAQRPLPVLLFASLTRWQTERAGSRTQKVMGLGFVPKGGLLKIEDERPHGASVAASLVELRTFVAGDRPPTSGLIRRYGRCYSERDYAYQQWVTYDAPVPEREAWNHDGSVRETPLRRVYDYLPHAEHHTYHCEGVPLRFGTMTGTEFWLYRHGLLQKPSIEPTYIELLWLTKEEDVRWHARLTE